MTNLTNKNTKTSKFLDEMKDCYNNKLAELMELKVVINALDPDFFRAKKGTVEYHVLSVLRNNPDGLNSLELINQCDTRNGSSIRSTISRMRKKGLIGKINGKWILKALNND